MRNLGLIFYLTGAVYTGTCTVPYSTDTYLTGRVLTIFFQNIINNYLNSKKLMIMEKYESYNLDNTVGIVSSLRDTDIL